MKKKLLAIIVLVIVTSLSIAGCTSSTNSNQAASNTSQAASNAASTTATTANTATSAVATANVTRIVAPTAKASATPLPATLPIPVTPEPQKIQPQISWYVMHSVIFMNDIRTLNRSIFHGEYTVSVSVIPYNACLPLKWYFDGQQVWGTNFCPQMTTAGYTTLDFNQMSNGYHTLTVQFDGDDVYYPASISGTFLLTG